MSAFDPPANTEWCPDCARERVSCRHLDADTLIADGSGDIEHGFEDVTIDEDLTADAFPDLEAMETPVLQRHYQELNEIVYFGKTHPDEVHELLRERKSRAWRLLRDRFPETEEPECPHCGEARWGQTPGDPKQCAGCGTPADLDLAENIQSAWNTYIKGTPPEELRADGSGLIDDIDDEDAETPAIDRARAVHPKWLELVDAASARDAGRVERLADELRGDLTFIERTIDDLASAEEGE